MIRHTRRASLAAAAVLAIATLLCFHRLTIHPLDVLVGSHDGGRTDLVSAYGAMRAFQREAVRSGQLPFWNPRILCGLPMLGNPQAAMFYPPNWLFFLAEPLRLMSWLLLAHHWFAGWGTFLLGRRYQLTFWSALLAGVAYSTAPFLIAASAEGHYNQTCVVSWIPWVLLGYERIRNGRQYGVPLTATAIALSFFAGHAQETYYLVLVASFMVGGDLLGNAAPGRLIPRLELVKRWGAVGVAVVGLVFIDLLPIWFYTKQAVRASGINVAEASEMSLAPASLYQLVDPFSLGGPEDYRGSGLFYWETLCHFGVVPLMLAVVGLAGGLRQYQVRRLAILAMVGLLFAFGSHTPVFPLLHRYLPGIAYFRAPARALYFCSFALALLAGFGMDRLMWWSSRLRQRHLVGTINCGLSIVLLLLLGILGTGGIELTPTAQVSLAWPIMLTASCLALSGALFLKPNWTVACCVLGIGANLAESTRHAHLVTGTIPPDHLRNRQQVAPLAAYFPRAARILVNQQMLSDREASEFHLLKLAGLEGVPLARSSFPIVSLMTAEEPVSQLMGFAPLNLDDYPEVLLDLTGISHAVVIGHGLTGGEGWVVVHQGTLPEEFALRDGVVRQLPYTVFRRKNPLPRAYVLGTTRRRSLDRSIEEQVGQLAPREVVLVDQDVLSGEGRQSLTPATIVADGLNRIVVETNSNAPGYLVLSDTYSLGWTAEVDGRVETIQPVNFGFRGVPLLPGHHHVEFLYEPPGLRLGALVTGLTAFWVLFLTLRSRGVVGQPQSATLSEQPN